MYFQGLSGKITPKKGKWFYAGPAVEPCEKGVSHIMSKMDAKTIMLQDAVCDSVRKCTDPELLDLVLKMLILEE